MAETKGACRCGKVQLRLQGKPLMTMACHCTGCQKMTASAFSLSSMFPAAAFSVVAGEPVIGALHGEHRHLFCPHCLSWMFTRPAGMDAFVLVRATMLDDAAGYRPFIETCTAEKLPWAATPAAHSFDGYPPPERYPALMAEFAEKG